MNLIFVFIFGEERLKSLFCKFFNYFIRDELVIGSYFIFLFYIIYSYDYKVYREIEGNFGYEK